MRRGVYISFSAVVPSFSPGFHRQARGEVVGESQRCGMAPWGDAFDLGSNRMRRAGRRLDARWKTFGLLAVAADRYAKELEKLPMQRPEFGDVGLQRLASLQ